MAVWRIQRLRESRRQQFRWAPHTSGVSIVKMHDYEEGPTVDAATPYAAWLALRGTSDALQPGDVLTGESGEMRIFKYVGFEEARWFVPEPAAAAESGGAEAGARAEAAAQA